MSDSPGTFGGEPGSPSVDWNDAASLHRSNDGGGLLSEFKSVRHGSLVELIRFVLTLPEEDRSNYVIEKAGDHRLRLGEILALSRRADFPG